MQARHLRISNIAVILLVIFAYFVSQGCAVKGMVSGYDTKVNFVGQVVDAASNEPLKGVTVNVIPPNSKKELTVKTGELGYFEIKNMNVGRVGGFSSGSSGGLATVKIGQAGYKLFAKKYPIEGLSSLGSALTTTDIGTINLEKISETSVK